MGNYIIPLEMSMIKQRYYRQYTNKQRIVKVILSFAILIIGGLIYVGFRDKSLLMFTWFEQLGVSGEVDAIRGLVNSGGAKSISSYIFIFSLPFFALLSEFLQYFGLFPGVFDWVDVASYLFAILLYVITKLIK